MLFGRQFHGVLLQIHIEHLAPTTPANAGLDYSLFARRLLRESHTVSFPAPT